MDRNVGGELAIGSDNSNTIQHSGSITITSEANINTLGENSTGLLAQSIAGGGGLQELIPLLTAQT